MKWKKRILIIVKQLLKELFMNRWHYHTSIFFLCQTFKSVERDIRKLFSNIFLFKVSKKEMEDIMDELYEGNKHNIDQIIKIVYDVPYNYLFISILRECLKILMN